MPSARPIAGFFLRLVVIYALLAAPWPGLQDGFARLFRTAGNWVFGSFGERGLVLFRPAEQDHGNQDTEILTGDRRTGQAISMHAHDTRLNYLLLAETLALILATPVRWSRKWKAALLGLVGGILVLGLKVLVILLFGFSGGPNAILAPGAFWGGVLLRVYNIVSVGPSFTFISPVFIWIVVAVRPEDLQRWRVWLEPLLEEHAAEKK